MKTRGKYQGKRVSVYGYGKGRVWEHHKYLIGKDKVVVRLDKPTRPGRSVIEVEYKEIQGFVLSKDLY